MKKSIKINLVIFFILLIITSFFSFKYIKQKKPINSDFTYKEIDIQNEYSKVELKSGLNLIALDLGGPEDINRSKSAFGDASILEQNNNYLLIDTGTDDENNILIDYLKAQNINHFSIYISHFHSDHYGKIKDILADDYFTVDNIYFPSLEIIKSRLDESKEWYGLISPFVTSGEKYINTLRQSGTNVVIIEKGSKIKVGEASLEVIWDLRESSINPDEMYSENTKTFKNRYMNDTSLVSMITYKGVKILNCGDIEKSAEEEILASNINIKADIFKFSHHGGTGSNTESFVNKVNPTYAYFPNNYTAGNNAILWYGDRENGKYKILVDSLTSKTNVLSTLYNGNIIYNISSNGTISLTVDRNYHTLTIKYLDEETNKEIASQTEYIFNDRSPYHLEKLKYIKNIDDYSFSSSTYKNNETLTEDKTIFVYYKNNKEPIVPKNEPEENNNDQDNQKPKDTNKQNSDNTSKDDNQKEKNNQTNKS